MSRIEGALDGLDGSRVSGWALDADAPKRVLVVVLFHTGADGLTTELVRVRANRPRPDLPAADGVVSHHGFEWRVPFPAQQFALSAGVAGAQIVLPGSPIQVVPRLVYEGHFDGIERGVVRGWARAWDPSTSVGVEIFIDGSLQATIPADRERRDLIIAQIGDGRCGFSWLVCH